MEYVKKNFPKVRIIKLSKNFGFAKAINEGVKASQAKYVAFLNNDTKVDKDWLKSLLECAKSHPEVISVNSKLVNFYDPKLIDGVGILINEVGQARSIGWQQIDQGQYDKEQYIFGATGGASLFRRKDFIKIGMFDENNLTEDLEISLRLQKYNYKIIQVLDSEVYTIAPETFKEFYKQRNRWYKGAVLNALNYKNMMFNRKYGDFGFIQMPRILIAGLTAVIMLMITIYNYIIEPAARNIYNLSLIDFNVYPSIKNTVINFRLIDFNYTNTFYFIVIFIIILIVLKLSYVYTKEKMIRHGYVTIPSYLILYSLLASIAWMGVLIDLIIKRKQNW